MKITKLEPSQHVKERWLCHMEDGSLLRVSENEVVAFGLYAGMELSPERLEELQRSAGESRVKSKALDLISHKPMSRKELIDKLTAKPPRKRDGSEREPVATPGQAAEVADWLEDLGYLNDAEYARTVARHYSAKGYGERKVQDELFRRGVPREYWPEAMEEREDPGEAVDRFLAKKLKNWTGDPKELKRAADALARKGFSWPEISEALGRYETKAEEL